MLQTNINDARHQTKFRRNRPFQHLGHDSFLLVQIGRNERPGPVSRTILREPESCYSSQKAKLYQ